MKAQPACTCPSARALAQALPEPAWPEGSVDALTAADAPELQAFFDKNSEYFVCVTGAKAGPEEAAQTIAERPPWGWPYGCRFTIAYRDPQGRLQAMVDVVSDLLAAHVWHIGLFIVADKLHGKGVAKAVLRSIERWAIANGAQWMRLGVLEKNPRGRRFWEKHHYQTTRKREGIVVGKSTHTAYAMVKPLTGRPVAEYLALVPRDAPGAP